MLTGIHIPFGVYEAFFSGLFLWSSILLSCLYDWKSCTSDRLPPDSRDRLYRVERWLIIRFP